MPTRTFYEYRPSRASSPYRAPSAALLTAATAAAAAEEDVPTYGSYLWRVIKDSVHGCRRVRNWSHDCKCTCCPHNFPDCSPIPKSRSSCSSKFAGTSEDRYSSSYPGKKDGKISGILFRSSKTKKCSSFKGTQLVAAALAAAAAADDNRLRLDVIDNSHGHLGRPHGTVLDMVVEKGSTTADIIEALTTHRQKVVVHWKSRTHGREELTPTMTVWELGRYASWLEIRNRSLGFNEKRVHWA